MSNLIVPFDYGLSRAPRNLHILITESDRHSYPAKDDDYWGGITSTYWVNHPKPPRSKP